MLSGQLKVIVVLSRNTEEKHLTFQHDS